MSMIRRGENADRRALPRRRRRLGAALGLTCGAALSVAAPVLASGGGEGPVPILMGDKGTAIWTLLIFVLVVTVLGKFAWGPILAALQKREQFIHDSLAEAKRDREEADRLLKEHTAQLHKARDEAGAIVAEGRRDAEVVRGQIKENAQKESQAMLDRAKREINLARDTAVKEIYELGAQLAIDAAARILGREINAQDHKRLIDDSIQEIATRRQEAGGVLK